MEDSDVFLLGDWQVEPRLNRLARSGETQTLQARTMDLLVYLAEQSETVSVEQILDDLWTDRVVLQAAVHQRIAVIRKALGDNARQPSYIETIRGRGYRIIAPITHPHSPEDQPVPPKTLERRLTVNGFRDLSREGDLAWLAEILHAQLQNHLTSRKQFRVTHNGKHGFNGEEPDLLVDGFLQHHKRSTVLNLRVVDASNESVVWAREFRTEAQDDYEKQNQLAASAIRFFSESLGGWPRPQQPQAYVPFLNMLNHRYYGDADEHYFWLKRAISMDPSWQWGKADLAMWLVRNASSMRDEAMIEQAHAILCAEQFSDEAASFACLVTTFLQCCTQADPASAETTARERIQNWSFPYAVVLLASGFAKESLEYLRHAEAADPLHPTYLEFQVYAKAMLGDWIGAMDCSDRLAAMFPAGSVQPQVIRSWAYRGDPELPATRELCRFLGEAIEQYPRESVQRRITAHRGYYPLAFEIAMADGDQESADQIVNWFRENGYLTTAAILRLRSGGACPAELLSQIPNQTLDGFFWWQTRLLITDEVRNHPVIRSIESRLGFTAAWQRELVLRAAKLPSELRIIVKENAQPAW